MKKARFVTFTRWIAANHAVSMLIKKNSPTFTTPECSSALLRDGRSATAAEISCSVSANIHTTLSVLQIYPQISYISHWANRNGTTWNKNRKIKNAMNLVWHIRSITLISVFRQKYIWRFRCACVYAQYICFEMKIMPLFLRVSTDGSACCVCPLPSITTAARFQHPLSIFYCSAHFSKQNHI